jgi:glycine/D-amino acid oxidase-like deaminating enzyme
MQRRDFLRATGSIGLLALTPSALAQSDAAPTPFTLPRIRASMDRVIATTVCTRPFRPQGARIEAERFGRKTIVHNYGHGGSGWSLSWGSSTFALRLALATNVHEIAVIGCGALGLTSALLAQRAGLKVKIYAKDRPPDVRSTLASGSWTPNSRYIATEHADEAAQKRWEEMARISFKTYQHLLGLPGDPIEWRDGYYLNDPTVFNRHRFAGEPEFPRLQQRIQDLEPASEDLAPGSHPFPAEDVRRFTSMVFNISAYQRMLIADFLQAGGIIETREFTSPSDIGKLRERTIINATGYGARALFGDESIVPVRGQLQRLIPQPEITYALTYSNLWQMIPRRDGIVLQIQADTDYNNADTTVDPAETERVVTLASDLMGRMA